MATLYPHPVMRHCRAPQNYGRLKHPGQTFRGRNYFCGDALEISVKFDRRQKITAIAWQGSGCALTQAAASIFSEMIKGKTLDQVRRMKSETLIKQLKIELSPVRRKCALLPLYTMKQEDPAAD
ncbi:MAG: hypothetical protein A2951_01000 [Candidatus Buchananbacteria bacterium RIFCSPLOWO2_01_FULL_56_15]|uniref:NIF system FeS cluster assembly NifU N-terminal domain-containing protein n=2 Tax=Candidatus Buchananiibacteriota TaxID=1817903 RepID=A0A1G1YF07_9BACT|nr:MAG: hypothetical protein A3J59_00325 [Candidatus Buchananbacteria bacterium RIFCSPHIGHO2_02_FULL_56_16]OGY55398.1 MAG: hypothetical protein A2951_01000 [Candidatus Buchananbacteria bacterium RIFCSPLOWO2_01_FULL_56_15]